LRIRNLSVCCYECPPDQREWQSDGNRSHHMMTTVNNLANRTLRVLLRIPRKVAVGQRSRGKTHNR
jgi:hypothetical protein